jgi:glycosyltransferase involved in cell wall biosynthesis
MGTGCRLVMFKKVTVSHPTANIFSVALVRYLSTTGQLGTFWTSIGWGANNPLVAKMPRKLREQLSRRSLEPEMVPYLKTHPTLEWGRLLSSSLGLNALHTKEHSLFSVDRVFRSLDRKVASWLKRGNQSDLIYAYEDGAIYSFRAAKEIGIPCVYDLPIAYWSLRKKLYQEEQELRPEWTKRLQGVGDSDDKLNRKTEEASAADLIVCPSDFVKESIPGRIKNQSKIVVVPFGSPTSHFDESRVKQDVKGPLRILFVATLSQRKGLADLFDALRLMPKGSVELHAIGLLEHELDFYRKRCDCFIYHGTMPRQKVLEHMQHSDVFVLPSIAEGRALVIHEAMSQGLPVILTPNTGAMDLIDEYENGFLVPIRDPEKIAEKLHWFLENRSLLPDMRIRAVKSVANFTWEKYAEGVSDAIVNIAGS